jgi:PAS domain-containing protein
VYGKITHNNHGELKRMYGIVVDISDQKGQEAMLEKIVAEKTQSLIKRNEELKKSEERYAKMAEEVQDYAILLLSPEGHILNWNKGAERIKGYKESEVVGKHFRLFYRPEDQAPNCPRP